MRPKTFIASAIFTGSLLAGSPAGAQDSLKLAIGQIDAWSNQGPQLGQDVGIFKKYNLVLESYGTQGTGESMQAVISGSADIGFAVGIAGVMRAYARGAPIRILVPNFTGTGDLFWYVRADSPLKSLKEATDRQTIAYSASGSSSHNIVLGFVEELGVKAKPTATGSPPGTLVSVMSGQIDIGWAPPPFGLKELKEGKIRLLARGSDVPSLRNQTVRVTIANWNAMRERPDVFRRFVLAYRESVDWLYSDPRALKMYAAKTQIPEDIVESSSREFQPKEALQTDEIRDVEGSVRDAIKLKFIEKPLTKDQLTDLIRIPPR